jgi:hypothetical protein
LEFEETLSFLNRHGRDYQFAPSWAELRMSALKSLNLTPADFEMIRDKGRVIASAALWDQRPFKQTVIYGYARPLATARPALNFISRLAGSPRLPAVGSVLAHSFVSHLAVEPHKEDELITLIAELRTIAARRGIDVLTLGFDAKDPRLRLLRRKFRCREYSSRLYVVRWPGLGRSARELDGRCLAPEVALL